MIDGRDLKKWLSKLKKLCQSRLLLRQYTLQFSLERYKSIMYYARNILIQHMHLLHSVSL